MNIFELSIKAIKVRLILFLLLTIPTCSYANYFDDNYIFGTSLIQQYVDIESAANGSSSDTGIGIGLYLDRYYKQKYRFNSSLSYVSYSQFDITGITVSADYLFPAATQFSLFAGASIGAALHKYDEGSFSNSAADAIYGIQLGGIKYLSDNYLIELGFRLKVTDLIIATTLPASKTTINNLNEIYFSVLFMF